MTEATVTQLKDRILSYCETAHTQQEIMDHLGIDRSIASSLMLKMVASKELAIAPGTCGKGWITGAKAKAMLKQLDGDA